MPPRSRKQLAPALTPAAIDSVLVAVAAGALREQALRARGFGPALQRELVRRADAGQQPEASFVAALAEAEAQAEMGHVTAIAGQKDWHARAWLLERMSPERWGQKVQIEVRQEVRRVFEIASQVLPAEHFDRLLEAVAASSASSAVMGEPAVDPEAN